MAIIRNTASMRLKGRVGNTTYYTESGRLIARVSQNSSNYGESARRSSSQQMQRAKWANLVNFYKVSKGWMHQAFESKKTKQSDYNRFMQLNTASARIYLTRNMYANGGCVVDAYLISEGSLRSVAVRAIGNKYTTDLKLGSLSITSATTIGEFSQALINNNTHVRENMQISFISYQQDVNQYGVPLVVCTAYEVTLDSRSTEVLHSYLPEFAAVTSSDACLGTSEEVSLGGFAYVLSITENGKTSVSTQRLVVVGNELIEQYTSEEAINASIESYGVDSDVFLMSGSVPQVPASQPLFISGVLNSSNKFVATGGVVGKLDDFCGQYALRVRLSAASSSVVGVALGVGSDVYYQSVTGWSVSGNTITLPYATWQQIGSSLMMPLTAIKVVTSEGDIIADFDTDTQDND